MALIDRAKKFLQSPQGQKVSRQAREQMAKPENQRKLRALADKMRGRRPH